MSSSLRAPTVMRARFLGAASAAARGDLDLEVGRQERERSPAPFDQHVGKDRQRMPPLDDAGDGLQAVRGARLALL